MPYEKIKAFNPFKGIAERLPDLDTNEVLEALAVANVVADQNNFELLDIVAPTSLSLRRAWKHSNNKYATSAVHTRNVQLANVTSTPTLVKYRKIYERLQEDMFGQLLYFGLPQDILPAMFEMYRKNLRSVKQARYQLVIWGREVVNEFVERLPQGERKVPGELRMVCSVSATYLPIKEALHREYATPPSYRDDVPFPETKMGVPGPMDEIGDEDNPLRGIASVADPEKTLEIVNFLSVLADKYSRIYRFRFGNLIEYIMAPIAERDREYHRIAAINNAVPNAIANAKEAIGTLSHIGLAKLLARKVGLDIHAKVMNHDKYIRSMVGSRRRLKIWSIELVSEFIHKAKQENPDFVVPDSLLIWYDPGSIDAFERAARKYKESLAKHVQLPTLGYARPASSAAIKKAYDPHDFDILG